MLPLAPLSVVLAVPYPTACPVGSPVSLGSDDSYVSAPRSMIAAVALAVGLVVRRRRAARRSLQAAPDGTAAEGLDRPSTPAQLGPSSRTNR